MRPFVLMEFLLIASLAVALIAKPPPREATAAPQPPRPHTTQVAATQPSASADDLGGGR
jgi:hypothetical protein